MKYIDVEKLIAEIDGILSACTKQTHTSAYNTCHRIKGIIASLQREQPEVDLEKAYKSYMKSRKDDVSGNAVTVNMKDLARHFYELGLNARKEE